MFGYDNVHSFTVALADPQADDELPIFRVPDRYTKIEILKAWAALDTAIAGVGTVVNLVLRNGGTAGTAAGAALSDTLGAAGTGDWTANEPRLFTLTEGTMTAGQYVFVDYDETGTVAPLNVMLGFDYVVGVGA